MDGDNRPPACAHRRACGAAEAGVVGNEPSYG